MRHPLPHLAVTVALLTFLAGCNQPQSPAQASDAATKVVAHTEGVAAKNSTAHTGPLYLIPAKLDACEPGAVVVVHWDMRETHPDISNVEIWTGPLGNQTLFAAGGNVGEASTMQAWAHPGTIFSVRNKAGGTEVATAAVDGPSCDG